MDYITYIFQYIILYNRKIGPIVKQLMMVFVLDTTTITLVVNT